MRAKPEIEKELREARARVVMLETELSLTGTCKVTVSHQGDTDSCNSPLPCPYHGMKGAEHV